MAAAVAVAAGGTSTQARQTPKDVEQVHPGWSHHTAPVTPHAFPSSINSDVYAYAVTANSRTFFAIAGRLFLHLKSGSTNRYTGNFVDYRGDKSYAASANASNAAHPQIYMDTANGHFSFLLDSNFGSSFYSGTGRVVPSAFGRPASSVYFSASNHVLNSATYNIILSKRTGPLAKKLEYTGTITFHYDANSRISGGSVTVTNASGQEVTTQLKDSGYYSTSYLYTVATIVKTKFGISGTFSGTSWSGNAFASDGNGSLSQWVISGSPAA